jgi:hypothetical protein
MNGSIQTGVLVEGRPHCLAALKANPRHPEYRQVYRNHLSILTQVHAGLLEQAHAVRTAETIRTWAGTRPRMPTTPRVL